MDLFKHAPDAETFSAGATIIRQGTPGDRMYVVLEGEADILIRGRAVEHVGPGDFFGEVALIDDAPRGATVVATTAIRLAPVDEKHFLRLVQETPGFALAVMRVLAKRLRNMASLA